MPIYEFVCQTCRFQFEILVRSASAETSGECPNCGSAHIKKAWSRFGLGKSEAAGGELNQSAACSPAGT